MEPRGSRVLCFSQNALLLVEHHTEATGGRFWLPPGGGREAGETFAAAAIREVLEETGIDVVLHCLLPIPAAISHGYHLFVGSPIAYREVDDHVDTGDLQYLRGAARVPVTLDNPLGPMNASHWSFLIPVIQWLLEGKPVDRCDQALSSAHESERHRLRDRQGSK